jgi:uncharacterized protein (DUF1499 family)
MAPTDPAIWHVDPLTVTGTSLRNSYLMRAGGDAPVLHLTLPPDAAATRLDAVALATPRTTRVAGQGGYVTYMTRSRIWGFPDFTSVRISAAPGGSDIAIFARSRFGAADGGVNKARVAAWIAQLTS